LLQEVSDIRVNERWTRDTSKDGVANAEVDKMFSCNTRNKTQLSLRDDVRVCILNMMPTYTVLW
jgi:hypothetical protein